jgi:DNA-binding transcriptional ArsR family regulator
LFRLLRDPSRILILNLLARAERPMSVGEIVERLDLAQSTVSHHLKLLADVGFVFVERESTRSTPRPGRNPLEGGDDERYEPPRD